MVSMLNAGVVLVLVGAVVVGVVVVGVAALPQAARARATTTITVVSTPTE